jgi:hypothetical protein
MRVVGWEQSQRVAGEQRVRQLVGHPIGDLVGVAVGLRWRSL